MFGLHGLDKEKVYSVFKDKIGYGLKNRKVLLTTLDSPFLDNAYVFPYLGILYLVSTAVKLGMRAKYVDKETKPLTSESISGFDVFYTDEFNIRDLDQYRHFDVIGISCMTPQGEQAYKILREIKLKYPDKIIMIGGPHAKFYLEECQKRGFDIIVTGDGERIFKELLLGDFRSLFSRLSAGSTSKTLIFNDELTEAEMNNFAIPYREKEYVDKYSYSLDGVRATTLVNSRGCPMGCAFCEHRRTRGRWFSPDHFEKEIQNIVDHGIKGIMIFDDLFAVSPKKIKPYVQILKRFHHKASLVYRCFAHANVVAKHPEILGMLVESGCIEIGFGAESASQHVLDAIYKGTRVEEMHYCVNQAIKAGINVKAFFMIGLPGETEDMFNETYKFAKKYRDKYPKSFDFDLAVFYPYKGTLIGNVVRLPEGETITSKNQEIDGSFFNIRPRYPLTWTDIDNGSYGAYKKKGGASDIVIETYDWKKGKVLLSSDKIYELKERAMQLSGRYTDCEGERIFSPVSEGSIGGTISKHRAKAA
jgi:anaerobic magnesium-protoporphyrin IX monomethyl ester cyclase